MTYREGETHGTRGKPRYRIAHLGEYFPELIPGAEAAYYKIQEWNKAVTWQKLEVKTTNERA